MSATLEAGRRITLAKDNCSVEWNNLVTDVAVKNEEAARTASDYSISFSSSPTSVLRWKDRISPLIKDIPILMSERHAACLLSFFPEQFSLVQKSLDTILLARPCILITKLKGNNRVGDRKKTRWRLFDDYKDSISR